MENSRNDAVCTKVVALIQHQLQQGNIPWHQPWTTSPSQLNAVSKKAYKGVNHFALSVVAMAEGYRDNRWVTFKQAADLAAGVPHGGVRKGEKGTPILFWHFPERATEPESEATTPSQQSAWARLSYVWNVQQCVGMLKADGGKIEPYEPEQRIHRPLDAAQAIHDTYAANGGPQVLINNNVAAYVPSKDLILLPSIEAFDSAEEYHGVRFHEEIHSTGAKHRLARNLGEAIAFNSETRGVEELTAELGSAMLRALTGITVNYVNSGAYVSSWSKALSDQPRMFATAASRAQRAVEHLTRVVPLEEEAT